jgi:4-carboxymuconolactone decarboxylase
MTRWIPFLLVLAVSASAVLLPAAAEEASNRLRPLSDTEWSPEVAALLGGTRDRVAVLEGGTPSERPKTLNILRTLAHHPKLLGPFLGFATVIGQDGALPRRDSELLALRASWNCRSEFEWGHHVEYARVAGLSDEEIARIPRGPSSKGWSEADRALLLAADQLHAAQQIRNEVWAQLAARYSEAQLVEIPFVVGQYTMLSMVANSTGVALEKGYDRLPAQNDRAK